MAAIFWLWVSWVLFCLGVVTLAAIVVLGQKIKIRNSGFDYSEFDYSLNNRTDDQPSDE